MQDKTQMEKEIIAIINEMQSEILRIGWHGVAKKYHPDINPNCPNIEEKFKIFRAIYEQMKGKLIV